MDRIPFTNLFFIAIVFMALVVTVFYISMFVGSFLYMLEVRESNSSQELTRTNG